MTETVYILNEDDLAHIIMSERERCAAVARRENWKGKRQWRDGADISDAILFGRTPMTQVAIRDAVEEALRPGETLVTRYEVQRGLPKPLDASPSAARLALPTV